MTYRRVIGPIVSLPGQLGNKEELSRLALMVFAQTSTTSVYLVSSRTKLSTRPSCASL